MSCSALDTPHAAASPLLGELEHAPRTGGEVEVRPLRYRAICWHQLGSGAGALGMRTSCLISDSYFTAINLGLGRFNNNLAAPSNYAVKLPDFQSAKGSLRLTTCLLTLAF